MLRAVLAFTLIPAEPAGGYGVGDIGNILVSLVNLALYAAGALAVIFLIIGGLKYVLSAGEPAKLSSAKQTILYAIVGLIIAITAAAIVNFVIKGPLGK